jgi:hypothetical protein
MTRAKDMKGKSESEIVVRTACTINTYRFIEMKSEEKKGEKKPSSIGAKDERIPKTGKK